MLIGLLPLAYIIYLSIDVYKFETEKVNLFKGYHQRISQSANISNLINELQNDDHNKWKLKTSLESRLMELRQVSFGSIDSCTIIGHSIILSL